MSPAAPSAPDLGPAPRALLAAADARLDGVARMTLSAERDRPRSLSELGEAIGQALPDLGAPAERALAEGLAALAEAVLLHFPGNLFWDLDHLAYGFAEEARGSADPAALLGDRFGRAVALHRLFGRGSAIRFRYVHDFLYGFDWAKWVRRAPEERASFGPFSLPFLRYIHRRGEELLALIEEDDAKYHRLRDARERNPFAFSREPEDEARLHKDLAARGLIPVPAWRLSAVPRWDLPFAEARAERAQALGIAANPRPERR